MVVRITFERQRIVRKLWAFLVNNLVWTPVLVLVLVSCFYGERWSLYRNIRLARLLWLNFKLSKLSLVLSLLFYSMGINNFVLFLYIERLKFMGIPNGFHSIVSSMFSLVLSMNTLWVMIPDMLINHLSSSRSAHVMIIVLHKIDRSLLRTGIKSIANRLLRILIVFSVLHNLLILLISNRSRWT